MGQEQVERVPIEYPYTDPGTFYGVIPEESEGEIDTSTLWRAAGCGIPISETDGFWSGEEEGVSAESALEEICLRLEKYDDGGYIRDFLSLTILEAERIFQARYKGKKHLPLYHNMMHVKWTVIHKLRAYVGALDSDLREYDRNEYKLIVTTGIFHEALEWWVRGTSSEAEEKRATIWIKWHMTRYLHRHNISTLDFGRVIAMYDFTKLFPDAIEYYLTDEKTASRQVSCVGFGVRKALFLGDLEDEEVRKKYEMVVFIGEIARFADFCQCIDLAYLQRMRVYFRRNRSSFAATYIEGLRAGPILLALEALALRPSLLEKFEWGNKHYIDWYRVVSSMYFFLHHFFPNYIRGVKYIYLYDEELFKAYQKNWDVFISTVETPESAYLARVGPAALREGAAESAIRLNHQQHDRFRMLYFQVIGMLDELTVPELSHEGQRYWLYALDY